jgi:two-component system, cell cycle sensor histidine kinase and response regulator CckA
MHDQVMKFGYSDEYEKEYIRKDRSIIPVSVRTFARTDSAHRYAGAWAIVRDVTERRRAQEALNRSEARFRALIEKATDIILVLDAEGRYRFWSPSASEALGWTAEEKLGRVAFESVHPDDRSRVVKFFAALLATSGASESAPLRYRCQHKDGSWRQIESHVRNCLGDTAVGGVVVNGRDVTKQRSLEEQVQQAQKLESVGRLAGGVAHDFNNLLTIILSGAEVLKQEIAECAAPEPEIVEEIAAAGGRARDLTSQLLAFAHRQVITPIPLDLNALLRSCEKLLRRVLGEDVEFVVTLQPGLWLVRCDAGQLEQVVLNLVVNARDAMPRGGKLVIETSNIVVNEGHTSLFPGIQPGPHVRMAVQDSGSGMSPEVRTHIFEPFFTTKPAGKGTGLGLATVYGIVNQSGGFIRVDSEPGYGTNFEMLFPRILDATVPEKLPAPVTASQGTETIMVVEDDPQVRAVTVRSLRVGGYTVLSAKDGQEALDLGAREQGPLHLLVTDVVMPGLDGRATAEALRRRHPELRVLYVSGHTEEVISKRGVLEPGIEFLPKPFTTSSLLARVRSVLDAG